MCQGLVSVLRNPRMRPIWIFSTFLLLLLLAVVGASPWKRDLAEVCYNSNISVLFKLFVQAEAKADVDAGVDEEVARGAESI